MIDGGRVVGVCWNRFCDFIDPMRFWKTLLRQSLALAGLSVLAAVLTWAAHPRWPAYPDGRLEFGEIPLAAVSQNVVWVDARSDEELTAGAGPGHLLLREMNWDEEFARFFAEWVPGQTVVVYCSSRDCQASKQIAAQLRRAVPGLTAYHLKGGWEAWKESRP